MSSANSIQLNLPASHKYLNVLGACISSVLERAEVVSEPAVVAYNVQLAVHEICTNIVDHAYQGQPDGRIEVTLALVPQPQRLIVDIRDTGLSFEPAGVPAPNIDEGQVRGYGLFLAHQLLDAVTYQPQPGGNWWQLIKNL